MALGARIKEAHESLGLDQAALARESRQNFVMPISTLRDLYGAKRAWIRVSTLDGYIDQAIIDGPKDSKALHAVGRLLVAIDGR